jgi:integrase
MAPQKLANGKYRVQIRIGGKPEGGVFSNKADALKKEAELRRLQELVRAGMEAPKDSILFLDQAAKYMRKRDKKKAKGTTANEESRLRLYFLETLGPKPISLCTTEVIRDLLDQVQEEPWKFNPKYKQEWGPLSNATRNRMRAMLHTIFKMAFMEGKLLFNPVSRIQLEDERVTRQKPKDPLSTNEAETLIAAGYKRGEQEGFCTVLFIYTGGRVSQIAGLQNGDFDLKLNQLSFVRIYEQETGEIVNRIKGHPEGIVIPLFPRVKQAFVRHMQSTKLKAKTDICLAREDGRPRSTYVIRNLIDSLCEEAKIRKITPHVLRATFATLAEEAGFSKEDNQKMLGHSTVQVTQRYTRRTVGPLVEKGLKLGFGKARKGKRKDEEE